VGVIFETDKRRIIPRWRNHKISLNSGVLLPVTNKIIDSPIDFSANSLTEQINSWESHKSLGHACDLFSSAYVLGIESEFTNLAEYLYLHKENISNVLLRQVEKVIDPNSSKLEDIDVQLDFFSKEGQEKIRSEISRIRTYLKKEPNNPIGWIELARNYTFLNHQEKAKNSVLSALTTDKNDNRFVLRSAARFFHHYDDSDRAHHIIKKAKNLTSDPWLMSAEIAFSTILKKTSRNVKKAQKLVTSNVYDAFHISELASAVGEVELSNGSYSAARKFYSKAMIKPTDNSAAQVLWIRKDLPGLDKFYHKNIVPLAFEANAHNAYYNDDYKEAYISAMRWFQDEPYSTLPIRLASYITSTFQGEHKKSISLLEHGLKINPTDNLLLNNLTYNLLLDNQTEKAEFHFKDIIKKEVKDFKDDESVPIIATAGLIYYRKGMPEKGREYYEKAIKLAKTRKNNYQVALATANYAREELKCKSENLEKIISRLKIVTKSVPEKDVAILTKKVLSDFEKYKSK